VLELVFHSFLRYGGIHMYLSSLDSLHHDIGSHWPSYQRSCFQCRLKRPSHFVFVSVALLAASIPLMSATASFWHGMPHFPIPRHQGGKGLTGFPHQGVKGSCALWSCYKEFLLQVRHIYTNGLFAFDWYCKKAT